MKTTARRATGLICSSGMLVQISLESELEDDGREALIFRFGRDSFIFRQLDRRRLYHLLKHYGRTASPFQLTVVTQPPLQIAGQIDSRGKRIRLALANFETDVPYLDFNYFDFCRSLTDLLRS